MSTKPESPLHFKISIVGDEGIGKEKFVTSFVKSQFLEEADTESGVISYKGNISIDVEEGEQDSSIWIWDLKEKKRFKSAYSRYLEDTHGIMLFFDLTNRKSFENLASWIDIIRENIEPNIPILLIGNTEDSKNFVVSPTEINRLIRKFNLYYIETSLAKREGVFDSFYCITSLSLGIDVNSELFLTKDIIYYPSSSLFKPISISETLTSHDLSKLGHKAIFERIDLLENKIKKSMKLELSTNLVKAEIILSVLSLFLFIIADYLYKSEDDLTDSILFITIGLQIAFVALIIISYIKRYRR